ncbi:MAG: ThiF family adenylyltransferase [Syntrophobacteraceae bacterium]
MILKDCAELIDHLGERRLIIEDGPLLEWAGQMGLEPWEAQIQALRERIIPHRYLKNFWSLGFAEQIRLCESRVFICGCGGLGGIIVELIARCGAGRIRIVDMDAFSSSNLNRQLLCDTGKMGVPKALAASERIGDVNPLVRVDKLVQMLDEGNADRLINGMDVVLDALDNIEGRLVLAETAKRLGIPFVHAAVAGWWGQISSFLPGSAVGFSTIYGSRRKKDHAEEMAGVPGPTPAAIGSLAALEAIRILAGKEPAYSGRLLYFDGENGTFEVAPLR